MKSLILVSPLAISLLVGCSFSSTKNNGDSGSMTIVEKRTFGQLAAKAGLRPSNNLCLKGRISELKTIDRAHGYSLYYLLSPVSNLCGIGTEGRIEEVYRQPSWVEASSKLGTSGNKLKIGMELFVFTSSRIGEGQDGFRYVRMRSPAFDIDELGMIVIRGKTGGYQIVEEATVSSTSISTII